MDFLLAAMNLVPIIIKLGDDVAPFAQWVWNVIQGDTITPADWTSLHQREDALRARLNQDPKA